MKKYEGGEVRGGEDGGGGAGGAVYPPKSLYLILVETEQHS